jgi:nitroreductase
VTKGFFDLVRSQRAHRSFSDRSVPDDLVERVLEAATFAPSAENRQPWVFVVVRDPTTRGRIGELTRAAWEGGGRAFASRRLDASLLAEVDQGATGGVSAAPVLVVVGADLERCLEATVASSIFPAVQNLLLAAEAVGLGSALTTLTVAHADELREIAGLPDHVQPVAVIPLGYPAKPLGLPRREPVSEHTHREAYGQPW